MSDKLSLTSRQRRGVTALLNERDLKTAAERVQVSERTLYRWLETPGFVAALRAAEGDALDAAARRLLTLQDPAISVITWVMAEKSNSAGVRLKAAQMVLDYLLKLRELRTLELRLEALEKAVFSGEKFRSLG